MILKETRYEHSQLTNFLESRNADSHAMIHTKVTVIFKTQFCQLGSRFDGFTVEAQHENEVTHFWVC